MNAEEKTQKIFDVLQDITYLEWRKIRLAVDRSFETEVTKQSNILKIATPEKLKEFLELL